MTLTKMWRNGNMLMILKSMDKHSILFLGKGYPVAIEKFLSQNTKVLKLLKQKHSVCKSSMKLS